MKITVNGDSHDVPAACTIADLLGQLQLNPKFLAVERNQQLVPRTAHADCIINNGDVIEIVTLVGGG